MELDSEWLSVTRIDPVLSSVRCRNTVSKRECKYVLLSLTWRVTRRRILSLFSTNGFIVKSCRDMSHILSITRVQLHFQCVHKTSVNCGSTTTCYWCRSTWHRGEHFYYS